MTTTTDVSPVSGSFTFPTSMGTPEKNAIIECAAPGSIFGAAPGKGGFVFENEEPSYEELSIDGVQYDPNYMTKKEWREHMRKQAAAKTS